MYPRARDPEMTLVLLMLAVLTIPPIVYATVSAEPPAWKRQEFTNTRFSGEPRVTRERFPNRAHPVGESDREAYSVRWETLLNTGNGGPTALTLSANGRSRVLVNGRVLIENAASPGKTRTRGAVVPLPAGEVRLTVEHSLSEETPILVLAASFEGERPGPIPASRLVYPE